MEAIIAAIIAASASIVIALIQSRSSQKQVRILREELLKASRSSATQEQRTMAYTEPIRVEQEEASVSLAIRKHSRGMSWVWWVVGGIVSLEAIIFGIINYDMTPFVNSFLLIPLTTIFLSFYRPVPWGYAAVFVTVLHGVSLLGYALGGGYFAESDIQPIALLFIGNAVVCALISFFRLRRKLKSSRS